MTWNLMHLARMLKYAGGFPAYGNQRKGMGRGHAFRLREPRIPIMNTAMGQDPTPASLTCQWPLRGCDWRARVVRLFEDGGEFRLLLVGGEDEQVIAGVQGGVMADRRPLVFAAMGRRTMQERPRLGHWD